MSDSGSNLSTTRLPEGVLSKDYSEARKSKSELVFRFKFRALVAANAINRFLEARNDGYTVLDFGAADGKALEELSTLIPISTGLGIEYNPELIKQNLPENLQLITGDVTNLPDTILESTYDVVTALAILEHLADPRAAFNEAHRVLKPGGLFIATAPRPIWDKISTKLRLLADEQHQQDLNKKEFFRLSKESNFKVLSFNYFMWAPLALLPYFGLKLSPKKLLLVEQLIRRFWVFNFLFVNQVIVLRRPHR